MLIKIRVPDGLWDDFLKVTNSPSQTIRELIDNHLHNNLNHVVGVDEAAKILNLSPGTVKNMCAADKLPCKKIGKTWVIDKTKLKSS